MTYLSDDIQCSCRDNSFSCMLTTELTRINKRMERTESMRGKHRQRKEISRMNEGGKESRGDRRREGEASWRDKRDDAEGRVRGKRQVVDVPCQ